MHLSPSRAHQDGVIAILVEQICFLIGLRPVWTRIGQNARGQEDIENAVLSDRSLVMRMGMTTGTPLAALMATV